MKEEFEFGIYELSIYATAKKKYCFLKQYRNEYFKTLYDMAQPSLMTFDEHLGRIYISARQTEEVALTIIHKKELYDKLMTDQKQKAELFERALVNLSELEKQVIQIRYFGEKDCTDLSHKKFYKVLAKAEQKLIAILKNNRQRKYEAVDKHIKAEFKQLIEENQSQKEWCK